MKKRTSSLKNEATFSPEEILLQKTKKKRSNQSEDDSPELKEKKARNDPIKDDDDDKIQTKMMMKSEIKKRNLQPDFWKSPENASKSAYKSTDDEIMEKVVGSRGGSTAVTAIIVDGKKLIVANVGDSRAIMCRNRAVKAMTVDHESQKEKYLVESRGGCVIARPGNVPRVDGQLAMTRAFGDAKVKEHITSEPDMMIETIEDDTEFIILASDGLWKVMSNEEASDCIKDLDNAQEASEVLVSEALSRKSLEDISCIVVMFH